MKEKQRFSKIENLREKVYEVLDCSYDMGGKEKELWNSLHRQAELISEFYEERGYTIWKH